MARRFLYLALAILFAFPFTLFASTPAAQAAEPIVVGGLASRAPKTDGKMVVWEDMRGRDETPPATVEVWGANLSDRQESRISTSSAGYQQSPAVSGGVVVWLVAGPPRLPFEIHVKVLATGKEVAIGSGYGAAISGDYVAWAGAAKLGGPTSLQVWNVRTMGPANALIQAPDGSRMGYVAIDGDRVVWMESGPVEMVQDQAVSNWTIQTMKIGNGAPAILAQGKMSTGQNSPTSLDFSGDLLVYTEGSQLKMINVKTGERRTVIEVRSPAAPTTDGRYVFWQEETTKQGSQKLNQFDLWGWDSATGRVFPAAVNDGVNITPNARGGWLVWAHLTGVTSSIYALQVSDLQPGTPIAPFPSTPDRTYFPATGHSLSFGFKYFWTHSGGLPVFGYPLTEEFTERNRDTGKDYTVQYFERQRFEYHPEFKGTPYETSLGRLGAEDAFARGITATDAFRPRTANSPNTAAQQFFPETTHWVSHSFLDYWKSHGLDFGDSGISDRESLALFGLPLSEEFIDPETGYVTQYFERAVFEYHPEFQGTPYEVELRLLGTDVLNGRGWL